MHGTQLPHLALGASLPHDTGAAIDFLTHLIPDGRVALAAIAPDVPGVVGRTFTLPAERGALAEWIEAQQGRANLYFTLNEPRAAADQSGRNGKLVEADVIAIRGVAIDVDPDPKAEVEPGGREREQARLDALVAELRGSMFGEPTAVVRSGAGVQAVWLFLAPLLATPDIVEKVKAQARGMELRFGSDAIHNLDRLLRLPGTVNLPDARKLARGRVPCPATVISTSTDRWTLQSLPFLAQPAQRTSQSHAEGLDLSEPMGMLGAPESLPPTLASRLEGARNRSPTLRRLLDPECAERFADRSAFDFALTAACVEAGFVETVELASIVAAYGSEKVELRGDGYLLSTVRGALAKTSPQKRPEEWFDAVAATKAARSSVHMDDDGSAIDWIDPRAWAGQPLPSREWEVEGWIPRGEVTLLYGDGAIGKTLLIPGYATCAATGRPWLGQSTRPARVLCFFCEDGAKELHMRQAAINRALGINFSELDNLRLTSRKGMDNMLALWERNTGAMKRQAVWERLRADALAFRADVVIIDTLADVYSGSEIDRAQVSAFVKSCLGRLAQEIGGSVIVLGHPSAAGKSSGTGTSGSTAWSNAARSRLYLRFPKGADRGNFRELEGMKANYGPKGNLIKLRWAKGTFEAISVSSTQAGPTDGPLPKTEDAAESAVLSALAAYGPERLVLSKNSQFYAPRLLKAAAADTLAAFDDNEVLAALQRLLAAKKVRVATVGKDRSRRPVSGFVIVIDEPPSDTTADNLSSEIPEQ